MSPLPPKGTVLCSRDALTATGAKGVLIEVAGVRYDLFVVAHDGAYYGYVNACPHQGTPLETFDDRFWDRSGTLLLCTTHGAQFRPDDGVCVAGLCRGKFLTRVPLALENDVISVA